MPFPFLNFTSPRLQSTYDCFTFFNELDILELRLRYLWDQVDHFVLVEAPTTHRGEKKPLFFEENKKRFEWAQSKIIHIIEDLPVAGASDSENDAAWRRENHQRNAISKGLLNAPENALLTITDADEIPSRHALRKGKYLREPHSLRQTLSYFYANYFCHKRKNKLRYWHAAAILPHHSLTTPQEMRDRASAGRTLPRIQQGGWHFSYFGGPEVILNKLQSFAHTEFDLDAIKSTENINRALQGNDLFGREGFEWHRLPLSRFPKDLREQLVRFPHFVQE